MTRRFLLGGSLAGLLLLGGACTRTLEAPAEVLESFAVSFTDASPALLGTREAPLAFFHQDYHTVHLDIEAVGSNGTRPLPWTGEVALVMPRGELPSQRQPVMLRDGKATSVEVRLRRVAGDTVIFVEDRLEGRNDAPPTYATGASGRLYFQHPTIAQIQETRDEGTSSMYKSRVEVTEGTMIVTNVSASGFNVTDVTQPAGNWNSLFVYAYNGVEGMAIGSQLLLLAGGITEFLGSTQLSAPIYAMPNVRCEVELSSSEGVEDTEVDEGGLAVVSRCPEGTTCTQVTEARGDGTARLHRCVPDQDPGRWDKVGRIPCSQDGDPVCPAGTACLLDPEVGSRFCLVEPITPPENCWPKAYPDEFPYCGPIHTDTQDPLVSERFEGALVKLDSSNGPIRVEGLPICKHVDNLQSVRSTCHVTDDVPDCALARAGERLLRGQDGKLCYRAMQACRRFDPENPQREYRWNEVRSTCVLDDSLPYCEYAEPGDEVLRNPAGVICRSTFDDFLIGGYTEFNQWKVVYPDAAGNDRCATIIADALSEFDPFVLQEGTGRIQSVTGTLKQTQFSTGSSFWIIEVRRPSDIQE